MSRRSSTEQNPETPTKDTTNSDDDESSSESTTSSSSSTSSLSSAINYVCHFCQKIFSDERELLEHLETIHKNELNADCETGTTTVYGCPSCSQRFISMEHLKNHDCTNKQTSLRLIRCSMCGLFATANGGLDINNKCSQCQDQNFISHSIFSTDQDKFYVKFPPIKNEKIDENVVKPESYSSDTDDRKLFVVKLPKIRQKSKTNICSINNVPGERLLCDVCNRTFKRTATLLAHRKIHEGVHKYKCEYCEKTFMLSEYHRRHLRVHTKEKPYACNYCGKSFSQSNTLKQHVRIHTGEKPYECTECGKAFSVRDYLNKHIRTHTGEKPYVCLDCGKKYSQQNALKKHQKIHFKIIN